MKLIVFLLLLFSCPAYAQTEAVADLAEDFIPVTEDFDGAKMTVFGALQSVGSDIVVVFEGPPAKALVREKVKQMGIWINGDPQTLEPVKSFYAVLSSRRLADIANDELRQKLGIGVDTLPLIDKAGTGLRENRMAKGLYLEVPDGVKIRDKKLFRADLYLPPNVPVGTYEAKIFEIQKGIVKASRTSSFKIQQVGLGSTIKTVAQKQPVWYAVLSLLSVLTVGFCGAQLFKKVS